MALILSLALPALVFGIGLIVSGMANPAKVLGFLDLAGNWDPSLAFVMAGAIAVGAFAFTVARRRTQSILGAPDAASHGARRSTAAWSSAACCSASAGASRASARGPLSWPSAWER